MPDGYFDDTDGDDLGTWLLDRRLYFDDTDDEPYEPDVFETEELNEHIEWDDEKDDDYG